MKKFLMLSVGLLLSVGVLAQNNKLMTEKLQKEYPNLQVKEAIYLPEIKLYEIVKKNDKLLSYTNEGVDFFLFNGELIDPKNLKNISKDRQLTNVQRFFNELPFEKSIPVKFGKGTRKIAVFTDPDCPFCKRTDEDFHKNLVKADVTVSYFMNPLRIPGHEQAPLKAAKIWCSPNKSKAWVDWMLKGELPKNDGTCKNPVAETKELSESIGFNSTPTIMFDNGYLYKGEITSKQVLDILNSRPVKN